MLKSWFIQNFKPILDSGDLKLAPVTVLAGRNSSGKSSLIQSILMIAQTLSSRILDRALLPNGPMVQLGTFEDILSEQTNLRTITVGFELEMGHEESVTPIRYRRGRAIGSILIDRFNRPIKSVKVVAQFRSASSNGTGASAIEASKVHVENVLLETNFQHETISDDQSSLSIEDEIGIQLGTHLYIKRLTVTELEEFLKGISPEYLRLIPYTLPESNYMGIFTINPADYSNTPISSLITFSHFLPTRLIRKYIIEERRRSRLMSRLDMILEAPADYFKGFKDFFENYDSSLNLPDSLKETITNLCENYGISNPFSGRTVDEFIIWYQSLKSIKRKRDLIKDKVRDAVVQVLLEHSAQSEKYTHALEAITNNIHAEITEKSVEQIIQFFTSKIRYLGPLRADPQAAQRFAPSSELDDVGAKGEYAAAVYDANQNARIRWYNPFAKEVEQSTLKTALDSWARYLGVAHEIKIQMAGQSGVSWQVVHIEGHKALPLTAVGVGVSQLLPILIMGLLAPENTLLLIEQPELHLHPSVQARLGDFFMGLAQCSKQCLIETHSENLVSQLRYHIVQGGEQERNDCLIYFADQDEQGAARFNPVKISPQGNILNWPDGFFDETMLQEDRITAASLKKRAKK